MRANGAGDGRGTEDRQVERRGIRLTRIRQSGIEFIRLLRHYPRALKLVWRSSPRFTLVFALTTVVQAAVAPAHIWISKYLIDAVVGIVRQPGTPGPEQVRAVASLIGLQVLVWMGSKAMTILSLAHQRFQNELNLYARQLILQKAAHLDLAFFESPEFYNQMKNSLQHSGSILNFVQLLGNTMRPFLTLSAMLFTVYRLHPMAMVVLIVTALPYVFVNTHFTRRQFNMFTRRRPEMRLSDYLFNLLGDREPVKEIRLFGLQNLLIQRYSDLWRKFAKEDQALFTRRQVAQVSLDLLSLFGMASIWFYAALQAITRRITLGDMTLYFQASESMRGGMIQLFQSGGHFYENSMALGQLFEFLDLDPAEVEGSLKRLPAGQAPLPAPLALRQGIEFRNVSFTYPGTGEAALKDVSFTLRPGESVALVGHNGAGKTTLVKLLTRLYDPTGGQILLEGRDLREYDVEDLRRRFGVIFQDFIRYQLTVRDNIGFGQAERLEERERIEDAADRAGCRAMIERLPQGVETPLGRTLAEGVDLSGGEWQKVALARAFMRDAPILVLDEPTASLDPEAEEEIFRRFEALTEERTTLIISHRFSTVRSAHRILLLEEGCITEEGSHTELMARNGTYARLYRLQADRYAPV